MRQPSYVSETQLVRRLANDPACNWRFTKHSLEEMGNENPPLSRSDIEAILSQGIVVLIEYKKDIVLRVSGADLDGRPAEVVVAVDEDDLAIKVVTAFCVKLRR